MVNEMTDSDRPVWSEYLEDSKENRGARVDTGELATA